MAVRLPPMQALRAFEAAARERSLTRAAESLHVTHGAISHQIKALESDLGVRLVERAGRGIRLTDDGERFAGRVRAAFSELTAAVQEIGARANPRLLRVSVVPSFAARWLLPRVRGFLSAHPDVDLDVRSNMANVDFQRDDADIAIRYGYGEWPGVTAEHLLDDWFFPVCSPRLNHGRLPSRPEDLARFTLIRSEDEPWGPWFKAAGLDWPEPARGPIFNDASHCMQAAIDGDGIALARSTLLANDVRNGVLVRPFAIEAPASRKFWLVYPPRSANSSKLALFRQWLHAEIAADRLADAAWASRQAGRRRKRGVASS
ncbi:MAG TPA: transcriptional regulator GcvA [Casimicrobiaceae bacterium]|nr:transcriptional regulator GcvA [Casimicrobiaceae bacterium]